MTTFPLRRAAIVTGLLGLGVPLAITAASPAAGGSSTSWVTISTRNLGTTLTTPSIARFGSSYEVVWVAKTGSKWSIQGRILDAAGQPTGSLVTLVKNWAGFGFDPTILADGKTRVLGFGGDKTGTSSPYDSDAEYYATSTNGTSWTLSTGSLSAADGARNGGAAVTNDSGTLITGLAREDGVQYHVGASGENPAPGPDPLTATTGNFSGDPGLGVDRATHKVWALWYSNSGINGKDGVNAQVIYPTKGSRVHAPGSSNPTTKSAGVQQDLSAAARIGGGVYTAYRSPNSQSIVVWKVGASKPVVTMKAGPYGVNNIVLTAAPHGRLWLYWEDRNDWRATRSNKAATRFGPVTVAHLPSKNDIENNIIAGNGSAGPLEAIAMITTPTSSNDLIARQFRPRLSLSAPHSVKRGGSLVVKVTDAGDPVKGATVHFLGHSAKTNSRGKVTFAVSRHAGLGATKVTASITGYTGVSRKVTIKA
jgi:hypothetical protein